MYDYDVGNPISTDSVPQFVQSLDAYSEGEPDDTRQQWDLAAEFEQLFRSPLHQEAAADPPSAAARVKRRRKRPRLVRFRWSSVLGHGLAGITAVVAAVVSMLGAMISYGTLRQLASPTAHSLAGAWPLLVYGPWFASCLSILHAAAHRRQVKVAWIALILFSAISMALCIAHAPRTVTAITTAGLPPVSAVASFHLLFRQITLLHPLHAKIPRQRKH
jgi:hypothetical protein